jgi:aspartyl-tRNA(Asn)/glutamyl-tRNA(Gln) amidotransferase subunit A
MCLAAIGTQTGGSIIRPATFCGVCGYKPEWLAIKTEGVFPFAPSLDHIGPLARTVDDLALVSRAIVAREHRGNLGTTHRNGEDQTHAPALYCLGGLFHDRCEPAMASAFAEALGVLAAAGARVVQRSLPLDEVHWSHRVIMACEVAAGHEQRLAEHRTEYRPRIKELIEEGLKTRAVDYARAQDHRIEFSNEVHAVFRYPEANSEPQAIALPAAPGPAPGLETTGDPLFNSPWSFSGHPVLSLPIGLSPDGLPVALQLVGPALDHEDDLFAAARWCERVLRSAARRAEG